MVPPMPSVFSFASHWAKHAAELRQLAAQFLELRGQGGGPGSGAVTRSPARAPVRVSG